MTAGTAAGAVDVGLGMECVECVSSGLDDTMAPFDLILGGGGCASASALLVAVGSGGESSAFARLDGLVSCGEVSIDLLRVLAGGCLGSCLAGRPGRLVGLVAACAVGVVAVAETD